MQHEYSRAPPQHMQPKASSWAELIVMGINCGSLEKKLHQLYCYLILAMPDVVCLQEVWTSMPEGWLNGLPYQHATSQPFRGGGLIILVHTRRTNKQKWKIEAKEHSLCVLINPGHPDSLAIATVHFPPRMNPEAKAKHCEAVAKFLTNAHATVSLIQGDLNENVKRSYKGWLKRTLAKSWKEYHCPYTTGQPTNHVITRKGVSMTEIDWMFLHSSTPCVACTRDQLPGLSTHNAQQYTLAIDRDQMKPTDPSNRRYDFRHLNQEDFQAVANACSILFVWANISEWHPTVVMHIYFKAMDDIIPRRQSKMSLTSTDARPLAAALQSHSGRRSAEIAQWWENRNNKAMATKLHFPLEKLKGVSITSATTHAIKLKKNKFQVVDKISADGKYFPKEKAKFQEEMLQQSQELYSGRPEIALDIEHVKKGMELARMH